MSAPQSPLARFLLVAYVLLVVYASLYPLAGWRDPGGGAFAFLAAPWPRWVTAFDLGANLLGYLPYGLLYALAFYPRLRGGLAVASATLTGAALSAALEAAQGYLPARISSNVDILANAAGALLGGAAGTVAAPALLGQGPLRRLRAEGFVRGAEADLCLTLMGLWLFAQLNPATLLFGTGDLRDLFSGAPGAAHDAATFVAVEAFTAAANLVAVTLLASMVTTPAAPLGRMLLVFLVAALAVKALAFAILLREHALAWLTPGAQAGLAIGVAVMLVAVRLPRAARLAIAAVLLMAATVLVNLAPPNPYTAATLKVWQQGHFLNFNGLTRLVSAAWPFAALGFMMVLAARRGRD